MAYQSTCLTRSEERRWGITVDQRVNQKGNEAPTLTPPWFKESNIDSYITPIHLCAEVTHNLPEGKIPKPNKL